MTAHTFVFADLAGYTALTAAHGDDQAADLAGDFCAQVADIAGDYGAEPVKTIGDAVMLRGEHAGEAVRLGLAVVGEVGTRHGFPAVRVGMHTGPAVERRGDWFGATVNVAARVAGAAAGGEVLLTDATRASAGDPAGVKFVREGERRFRNVSEPVVVHRAVVEDNDELAGFPVDPVCRMAVDPRHAAGSLRQRGVSYCFCSLECAQRFAADPGAYAPEGSSGSTSAA